MPYPYDDATGALVTARRSRAQFTRPANTTAYAIGDVVNANAATTPIALPVATPGGEIVHVRMSKDAELLTNALFRVHFFDASFTISADNAQLTQIFANGANYLGHVDLPTMLNDGAGSGIAFTKDDDLRIPFGTGTIYAVIVAMAAYVPASGEKFALSIGVRQ